MSEITSKKIHSSTGLGGWAMASLGRTRYGLLLFGVACQIATVWITWPLWQSRVDPPNLPTFAIPEISFGWLVMGSLLLLPLRPRAGIWIHWLTIVVAGIFDQYRLQPQFFANAILMTACLGRPAHQVARWFLVSTWLWAGLQKLLSPDWYGHASHWLVERAGYADADSIYLSVAVAIAVTELVIGLLALFRPRWAAIAGPAMHLGIVVTLSPWVLDWNVSVIPWNLAMAVIGGWILWTTENWKPVHRWETVLACAWLIAPAGFFVGWVDHGFSGVLYSDSLPQGLITGKGGVHRISGWGDLAVPFPYERRTLRIYFEQTAQPGDKMHLADPRPLLEDKYYVLDANRRAFSIDAETFFSFSPEIQGAPAVWGVGLDRPRAIFALKQAGVRMVQESIDQPVYAVAFTPQNFESRLLPFLSGLPNLQQVQLAGTDVTDDDLRQLSKLRLLTGIGLNHTQISDAGLSHLRQLPYLQYVEHDGTRITESGLRAVLKLPPEGSNERSPRTAK